MREAPLIIYHHIPKTAGSSVRVVLSDHLGPARVWWHLVDGRFKADATELVSNQAHYDVIGGHIGYRGILKLGFTRPLAHFALVRDPIDLILSASEFVSTREDHRNHTKVPPDDPDFLDTSLFARFANIQCRMLGGRPDFESTKDVLSRNDFTVATTEKIDKICGDMLFLARRRRPDVAVGRVNQSRRDYRAGLDIDALKKTFAPYIAEDTKLYSFIAGENDGCFSPPAPALASSSRPDWAGAGHAG